MCDLMKQFACTDKVSLSRSLAAAPGHHLWPCACACVCRACTRARRQRSFPPQRWRRSLYGPVPHSFLCCVARRCFWAPFSHSTPLCASPFRILAKCLSIFRLVLLFGFPFILILRMRVSVRLAIGRAPGGQSGGARCIAIHRRARIRCAAAVPVMNAALTHALASRQCAGEERTDHRRLHRFRRLSAVRTLKHPVEYPLST
jgi:hypothetical protein